MYTAIKLVSHVNIPFPYPKATLELLNFYKLALKHYKNALLLQLLSFYNVTGYFSEVN